MTGGPDGRRPLHDPLPGLVDADDRATYADSYDLDLGEDGVVVVVELALEGDLPSYLVEAVQSSYAGRVQAVVAVDRLRDLAGRADVSAVRPPREAQPL